MTNPVVNFSSNQTLSNPLPSTSDVQAMIDSDLASTFPIYDNALAYSTNDIVVYSGMFYKALSNISSGGGVPTTNAQWERKARLEYTTTATAAGTTTLTGLSTEIQFFTGATTQTVQMPVVSTLSLGRQWIIYNKSSGVLTINSSGSNAITTIPAGNFAYITCILITGTTAVSWAYDVVGSLPTSGTNLTLSGYLNEAKGSDIASATTTDIGAATGNYIDVTGTTTITGLGTIQAGTRRIVRFTGALTLTHNGTSLILPNATNITTVASDVACFISLGSGNWRCVWYTRSTWTGSGSDVKATSPTLVTPVLGVATATTINKVALTAPATGSTLTILDGKTLTANKSLTLEGTDSTTHTFPSTSSSVARIDAAQSFTGTQTFNNYLQLSENGGILLDQTLSADGKFSISKGRIGTLGETISSVGTLVYYKASDSRWWRTDSDAAATSVDVPLALVCVTGNAGDDVQLMEEGVMRSDALFPTLTIGAPVYIGSSAGAIQVAKPTSGFIRVVGYGDTADALIFKPSNGFYEIGETVVAFTAGSGTITIHSAADTITWKKESGYCTVTGYLLVSGVSTPSGAWNMTGLPYTAKSGNQSRTGFGANASGLNFGDSIPVVAYVPEGNSVVTIQKVTNGVLGNLAGDVVTNTELVLGFTYPTST